MQVSDEKTPTIAEVKRKLNNAAHELKDITSQPQQNDAIKASQLAALHRVREAMAHLDAADRQVA